MKIVFLTSDLMFQSRVSAVCKANGLELVCQRTFEGLLANWDSQTFCPYLIVDLTLRGLDLSSLVATMRRSIPNVTLMAYGPHVQTDALAAAKDAGFDYVWTRGQFDRDMNTLLSGVSAKLDSPKEQ